MNHFSYLRPATLAEALALLRTHAEARPLAGGQSLLAAMKLGLSAPTHLVDLQDLEALQAIRLDNDGCLQIGALATHAAVAASPLVRDFCPMLAALAGGIADQQVREAGTLGGALAHNDPAACWPAGVLALGATLCTDRREIAADDYFQGLYTTALEPGELLTAVRFARPLQAAYHKHEQPASRFALVGVALARFADGTVRVAITGLGQGVVRHAAAEQALCRHWHHDALLGVALDTGAAHGDIHASAAYRVHLAGVWCRRLVQRLATEATPSPPSPGALAAPPAAIAPAHQAPPLHRSPHAQTGAPAPQAATGPWAWLRRLIGR